MTFRLGLLSTRVNKGTTQDSDFLLLETGCGSPLSLSVQAIIFCIPITDTTAGNRAPLGAIQWVNQDPAHVSRKPCYEFMNKIHPEWMSSVLSSGTMQVPPVRSSTKSLCTRICMERYIRIHGRRKTVGGNQAEKPTRLGEDVKKPVRPTKTVGDPCFAGGWVSCVVW
ncbi:hypothetical protein CGRA01v4_00338 [Colletotrichum graminicola]|nr:hypothetical protein CGRA01v4_00338 [Colletotrichum graminicola]